MKVNFTLPGAFLAQNRWITTLLSLLLFTATAQAQTTYYWRGATGDGFTAPTSWNTSPTGAGTNRTSAASTDILVFDGGTPVVTVAGQTIGRLKFINNTSVTLNSANNSTNNIAINGDATDDDLIVESGSSVALTATGTTSAGVTLSLAAGTTGRVSGTVALTNATSNPPSANKLISTTVGSLHFINGGKLSILGTSTGTAFTGVPVFEAGSTLEQNAANSSDHSPLAVYQSGSTFRFISGTFGTGSSIINRTFGNLEYASASFSILGDAMNLTVLNNLSVIGTGTLTIAARGNTVTPTGTLIGGNLSVSSGTTLNFLPTGGAPNVPRVTFNGTTPQIINNAGTLTFGINAKLEINNPAGVTLQNDLTIANDLLLTNGLLTTGPVGAGQLTMSTPTAAATGSSTSFVNGPLARLSATGNSTLAFPVGRLNASNNRLYRPISLALTSHTNAVTYTAQQTEGSATPFGFTPPIDHVLNVRYYTVSAAPAPIGGSFSARISLTFGPEDYVTNSTTASLVVAKRNGAAWASIGSTNTGPGTSTGTGQSGTLTSGAFTSFSDFTLASLDAQQLGFPGLNPLPVLLTRFDATAKSSGVALNWATASEKNSAYFEVQRSATGQGYETIGRVAAQGSSSSLRTYAFLDAHPLAGLAYYRLRQVDNDGTTAYSPVATALAQVEKGADTRAYPNPTSGLVLLPAMLSPAQYRLLDAVGRPVLQGPAVGGSQLDLGPLPRGAFWLELTDAAGTHVQRLVRE
ncbi:T9SS type A sorting domain-containing protein [Hymenobacter sp. UYCo722]|uniref:T9SS type A sorting domain-containing protein n=1 Tax=Hymenobacter sp. UYCo722 TaxID=3156335 RepID=UPI0033996867